MQNRDFCSFQSRIEVLAPLTLLWDPQESTVWNRPIRRSNLCIRQDPQTWHARRSVVRPNTPHVVFFRREADKQPIFGRGASLCHLKGKSMSATVRELMNSVLVTIDHDATLDEVLELAIREGVSEVYVNDAAGRLVGVVPDYELLKAALMKAQGSESISRLTNRGLMTIHPDTSVGQAAALFRDSRCSRIAIVEDCRLVGQVNRRDVLRTVAHHVTRSGERQMVDAESATGSATGQHPTLTAARSRMIRARRLPHKCTV